MKRNDLFDYLKCILWFIISLVAIYIVGQLFFDINVLNFMKSDIQYQYVHLFNYLRDTILNGNFPMYSFSLGFGSSLVSTWTYYCMNPLNLVFLFSKIETILMFFNVLVVIKLLGATITMKYYLKQKSKNNNFSTAFALIYGLNTLSLFYVAQIMWLDCILLFPLIALGVEKIVKENKYKLYFITLSLSILFNYYISFSICVFLLLYYLLLSYKEKKWNNKTFIVASLFAVLINSWFFIPTIFDLLQSKVSVSNFDSYSIFFNYNLLTILPRLFMGNMVTNLYTEVPFGNYISIYFGLFNLIIIILNIIKTKKVQPTVILALVLLLFTWIKPIDTILHCFAEPDLYPYRYAYIIIFFMLISVYEIIENYDFKTKNINKVVGVLIALLFLFYSFNNMSSYVLILIINVLFIILYMLFLKKKHMKKVIPYLIIIEVILNSAYTLNFWFEPDAYKVPEKYSMYEEIKNDKSLYRTEIDSMHGTQHRDLNSPLSYGINGTTFFLPTITSTNYNMLKLLGHRLPNQTNPPMSTDLYSNYFNRSFLSVKYYEEEGKMNVNENVFPMIYGVENIEKIKVKNNSLANYIEIMKSLFNEEEIFIEKECQKDKYCKCLIEGKTECKKPQKYEYYGLVKDDGYYDLFDLTMIELVSDGIIYILDKEKLDNLAKTAQSNALVIDSYENGHIIGNINNEQNNKMFTTIPYDKNWKVYVNGKEVDTSIAFDSVLAFDLEKGELNIELIYKPKYILTGIIISLLSFASMLFLNRRIRNEK